MDVTPLAALLSPGRLLAEALPGLSNGQMACIAAIVGVSALLMITTRRRIRQAHNSPRAYVREQVSRLRSEQSLVTDIEEVMAQLEQFSRQMQARLDTRFAKLEAAIRDADQRSDRLEHLLRRAAGGPTLEVTVDDRPPVGEGASDGREDCRHQTVFRLADAGLAPAQIAEETLQTVGEVELILALRKASTGASPVG